MKGRIGDIEVLRGFAVLLVVLHHAHSDLVPRSSPVLDGLVAYLSGWYGVDLFFAISGFVIARDLLPRLSRCPDNQSAFRVTVAFWIRRAWRLLPSAWLWLLLILLATRLFNDSGAFGSWQANLEATVAGVLQVANIRFAETFGQRQYGASFAYWSLSLEEQFYLCLPLIALLTRRWLPYLLIVLITLQMVATRDQMLPVFRSDALMLGVLLSMWSQNPMHSLVRPTFVEKLPGKGTLPLMLIILCMGIVGSGVFHVVSYKYSVIAALSALLVWIASYDADLLVTPKLPRKVLIWIGSRSYGIYLIHIPAFFLSRELLFRLYPESSTALPLIVTATALLLILSEANYRLIEVPLRLRGTVLAQNFLAGANSQASADNTTHQ